MPAVVFDTGRFLARFPEFDNVADEQLQALFNEATLYLDNTDASLVTNVAAREALFMLLVAHLAQLNLHEQ